MEAGPAAPAVAAAATASGRRLEEGGCVLPPPAAAKAVKTHKAVNRSWVILAGDPSG